MKDTGVVESEERILRNAGLKPAGEPCKYSRRNACDDCGLNKNPALEREFFI